MFAVDLVANADPCPWPSGRTCVHHPRIENLRTTKLYQVAIHSKGLHGLTELDGVVEVITHHAVISSQAVKTHPSSIGAKAGSSGMTDEILTTTTYYDETQQTVNGWNGAPENQVVSYELDIP